MHIWIDADACPADAKDVMFNAVRRIGLRLTLVANSYMNYPKSDLISFLLVKAGPDAADNEILEQAQAGDLVVTADIPLAAEAVAKDCYVIDPRGDVLDRNNVGSRLATRNFLADFRASGGEIPGPPPYTARDKRQFANQLDKLLTRVLRTDV